ncbi:potassium transporter [Flavobacterium microcysteis]|uniref:Potassium transporter n=2 Tax=Flavobacterium microcysteis TaxID=2596891 RepID=A0A501QIM6_9FLAO|nr:potassium transporter [Flavobacterium microcysteis]
MQDTFFFQAMIYLAGAVIMVPIAKRLGLGSVLGYLLAGIIIGPAFLGLIGTKGHDIMHFAEFGVVMMLFVIGLELEPERLWRMRKKIAGMGGIQVAGTTLVLTAITLAFGLDWKTALVLGMIISMSSTAIVMQTLNEKGWIKTVAGRSSFAVLLFQDIAIIPMLALLPLLASKELQESAVATHATLMDGLPKLVQTLIVLSSIAVVILSGKYLLRPIFHAMAKTKLSEMFTAMALLVVVGIAVLMTSVGLSPALGAFLAGVMLANSEYKHQLEIAIDPFKGLLLGLFFISVGSSIDFQLLLSKPWFIMGLVLGIITIKITVLYLLGKFFKIGYTQNFIFSFGLSQIGEFAFVLLSFSLQENILSKEITDLMMAVTALSMAFTPLLMMFNEKVLLKSKCSMIGSEEEPESDVDSESNPVIIAGYGHFGNTVGRFLRANNIQATVLDNNSDNVNTLRKLGFKVYYGDASRHDLLEIAGAGRAQIIIIAIGNREKRMEMIEMVKKHFPNLYILVRSENRDDAYDQMNAGIMHIYRETLDTSLRVGIDVMKLLGHNTHEATRSARTFFTHDEKTLKYLASIRNQDEYISAVREKIEELERVILADREAMSLENAEKTMLT